jgi:hypothetical protein
MTRYATRPTRAGGWVPSIEPDDHNQIVRALLPDLDVPGGRGPIATGLYDLTGNELFRLPEPLGFHNPLEH